MRPRLNEVAALAGVSEATVSRVLNGKPGVAAETRQIVLGVLADLGYRDQPARGTAGGIVGIITPEMDNPIFPLFAQAIEARLARLGYLAMVCPSTGETVAEQDYLDHFVATQAAGVVVINGRYCQAGVGYDPYLQMVEKQIPVVLVNGMGPDCPLPAVAVDIRAAAMQAMRHLQSLGHERIGCLTGPSKYVTSQLLHDGYVDAMSDNGSPFRCVSETLFTFEGGQAGAAGLLDAGVTGVVAASDLMALGAIAEARSLRKIVPDEVSVVGFDGTPFAAFTDPPLTTLRQPVERMSTEVASLLLSPPNGSPPRTHTFLPELVVAGSTGPRR